MARQSIVTRDISFIMSRRLEKEPARTNMHGFEAKITVELMGAVNEDTGRLLDPDVLDRIVNEKIIQPFDHMLVLRFNDPLIETLSNKPLINNAGWDSLVETMKEGINRDGYYDTRRQSLPPFYDGMRPLVIAEHPTSENLAYLVHRLLAPHVYNYGVGAMRVKFCEREKLSAVYMGDVRPSPDYPQVA